MATPESTNVLVPLKLDAFVLNPKCCDSDNYKIAPITQPNYTFLRLKRADNLLESDLLDQVDLHACKPASLNPRLTDLGSEAPTAEERLHHNRLGVYLHWVLPQLYRSGSGAAPEAAARDAEEKHKTGYSSKTGQDPALGEQDTSAPEFRQAPNRWMVTRRLEPGSYSPADANIPQFQSWIIQSDALRRLSDYGELSGLDLEVDAASFVDSNMVDEGADGAKLKGNIIESQGEVFVGKKVTDFDGWNAAAADSEPHVNLTVMTSANPLLPDYQIHNPNIFSMVDNFEYKVGGETKYLESAKADYVVIGWHSEDDDDPFTTTTAALSNDEEVPSHLQRLQDCRFELIDPTGLDNWLNLSKEPARTDSRIVCHAMMYDVKWDKNALPETVLAEEAGKKMKEAHAPVAVGTSDVDAIVAYLESLTQSLDAESQEALDNAEKDGMPGLSDKEIQDAAAKALELQTTKEDVVRLIYVLGESGSGDLDSLQKFSDSAYKLSFERTDAGKKWFWKAEEDEDGKPQEAGEDEIKDLDVINMYQAAIDSIERENADLRWKIFAYWWTKQSSFEANEPERLDEFKARLNRLLQRLDIVDRSDFPSASASTTPIFLLKDLREKLKSKSEQYLIESKEKIRNAKASNFYRKQDPHVVIPGIEAGWEPDFTDTVKVRVDSQLLRDDGDASGPPTSWEAFGEFVTKASGKAPEEIRKGVKGLLREFYILRPTAGSIPTVPPQEGAPSPQVPHFHLDERDMWSDTQPWRPLFIEWEVLYYHVPFETWKAGEFASENTYGARNLQYSPDPTKPVHLNFDPDQAGNNDIIRIHGRNYLQPQATGTFKYLLTQVFQNTNPKELAASLGLDPDSDELESELEDLKTDMLALLAGLKIISSPLTAVTHSLLTLLEGAHLSPLVRLPRGAPLPLTDAVDVFSELCVDRPEGATAVLQRISSEGDYTPFSSSVPFSEDFFPLKQVAHGQVQFIKFNVVDKFGQAVHVVDPEPARGGRFHTFSPIISESLTPNKLLGADGQETNEPNVALRQAPIDPEASDLEYPCPFFNLPPAINQPARINAFFVQKVKEETGDYKWRRTTDWDNPIWGWVVVNYANSGIQFFFPDGQFYREVRFSQRGGSTASQKYLPFERGDERLPTGQLDQLINELGNQTYLLSFWDMINKSIENQSFAHAPSTYSNFSSAVIGRPMALVNAGWSVQLANMPSENWAVMPQDAAPTPPRTLMKDAVDPLTTPWADRQHTLDSAANDGYLLRLKVGDDARRFDGLVAYFKPNLEEPGVNLGEGPNDLNLSKFHTFPSFIRDLSGVINGEDPRVPISDENFPKHTPYFLSPSQVSDTLDRHDDKLRVLGLLVDPFLPVHAYSGMLPIKPLKLPEWTVERALKRMTAFWHAGPLLIPQEVPAFSEERILETGYLEKLQEDLKAIPPPEYDVHAEDPQEDANKERVPTVQLPISPPVAAANGGAADFVWLQPFRVKAELASGGEGETGAQAYVTRYNSFGIDGLASEGADALKAKLPPGPYTAITGYLQITRPLEETAG
ncbi:uncharacterized protein MKZ38_009348 [Zalerion maritima]|uniref:Channel forming colicins domain-containing protein n=1 Tax=Zalerion maritima TaxID=339359 RepID=A0AAD5WUR1_9PEZI|nr:uncharacterized protein MKZ38_009348 [Zalerion maritima]